MTVLDAGTILFQYEDHRTFRRKFANTWMCWNPLQHEKGGIFGGALEVGRIKTIHPTSNISISYLLQTSSTKSNLQHGYY